MRCGPFDGYVCCCCSPTTVVFLFASPLYTYKDVRRQNDDCLCASLCLRVCLPALVFVCPTTLACMFNCSSISPYLTISSCDVMPVHLFLSVHASVWVSLCVYLCVCVYACVY